jgi:hypothetical protein
VIGTRPFEQIPFQWSVHVEETPGSVRHAEFLAIDDFGNFDAISVALITALPASGPIFAYNASFEGRVLLRLADWAPDRASQLRAIAARLVDLLPITRAAYYHRDMRGSWSIKSVMPTIDPQLGYQNLEEVQEGDGAQQAFLELRTPTITPAVIGIAKRVAQILSARYVGDGDATEILVRRLRPRMNRHIPLCSQRLSQTHFPFNTVTLSLFTMRAIDGVALRFISLSRVTVNTRKMVVELNPRQLHLPVRMRLGRESLRVIEEAD